MNYNESSYHQLFVRQKVKYFSKEKGQKKCPRLLGGIKVYGNWPTIPQLYLKGELVGGSDIMTEMFESGELKTMLEKS